MAKNRKNQPRKKKPDAKQVEIRDKMGVFQVENPIICRPYTEPDKHWSRDRNTGEARRETGRRPAGYWYRTEESRTGSSQKGIFEEDREDLPLVNLLREDVAWWREEGYPNSSRITKDLLSHWFSRDRQHRLFFCQREAVETIIYLKEIRIPNMLQSVGGKDCKLSADDLGRLLQGQNPSFKKPDSDFSQTLLDKSSDVGDGGLVRFGCKMATGSGKTLVMAMLIAWAFCNSASASGKKAKIFPRAALICCPNLTVKKRLAVLRLDNEQSYYQAFDLVPERYLPAMRRGRVIIHNWQALKLESHETGIMQRVKEKVDETPEIYARRILNDAADQMPIMVLNDEGHHCWRPKPSSSSSDISKEEMRDIKAEKSLATVWVQGLDKLNAAHPDGGGISFCVDLSATPFYIKGSGYPEGWPFPWLVSDFGLVDAIESGLVKIPQVPIQDTAQKEEPRYFRLWEYIKEQLQPGEYDHRASSTPSAEAAYKYAEPALQQIAGQWKKSFKGFMKNSQKIDAVPPALIIVCDNTEVADVFYRKISGERQETLASPDESKDGKNKKKSAGKSVRSKKKTRTTYGRGAVLAEYFSNSEERKYTIQIDSKVLQDADTDEGNKSQKQAAENLRNIVATIGRPGEPGEHVRCVISVAMLTEGWDANNVKQILGVRAFRSQLLCEQVVGRGLRRMNYVPDPETGLLIEEYVDVYGIPFSVIPCKGRPESATQQDDRPTYRVKALEERACMEMTFPCVENYVFHLNQNLVRCDVDKMEEIIIEQGTEPIVTIVQPPSGSGSPLSKPGPFKTSRQDRQAFYESNHIQQIKFNLAHHVMNEILGAATSSKNEKGRAWGLMSRHQLFPQILEIVDQYVERKVKFEDGVNECELGLERHFGLARQRLCAAIVPNDHKGELPLLPVLNSLKPEGTTWSVDFPTTRECFETTKSHINLVALDSDWEGEAAATLEEAVKQKLALYYARIYEKMGFKIICGPTGSLERHYMPDFLVRMVTPSGEEWTLILEIKGLEEEWDRTKHEAAKRWVAAVNNWGEKGQWGFYVCRNPKKLLAELEELHKTGPHPGAKETD